MKTYFVDSFTNQAFKGNPAAVVLLQQPISAELMQNIATEIGFSETAFISKLATTEEKIAGGAYSIRYFSPKMEIPLCGHATLAAAKVLFSSCELNQLEFTSAAGVLLPVRQHGQQIVMSFPLYDTHAIDVPAAMLQALGINSTRNTAYSEINRIILLEIDDAKALALLQPDFAALLQSYSGINGVLVTAKGDTPEFDFHYRYFWPWAGTNEDPVTGGVQCFLTKYWAQKLQKTKLSAFQASARTGTMQTELIDDKVLIYGEAVIVLAGELQLQP